MNLSEFKAWFEGFTEQMDGPPNAKQWKRIAKKVEGITSDPTPWPVFVDRYVRPYPARWEPFWVSMQGTSKSLSASNASDSQAWTTNASDAFIELGRAEYSGSA